MYIKIAYNILKQICHMKLRQTIFLSERIDRDLFKSLRYRNSQNKVSITRLVGTSICLIKQITTERFLVNLAQSGF